MYEDVFQIFISTRNFSAVFQFYTYSCLSDMGIYVYCHASKLNLAQIELLTF